MATAAVSRPPAPAVRPPADVLALVLEALFIVGPPVRSAGAVEVALDWDGAAGWWATVSLTTVYGAPIP